MTTNALVVNFDAYGLGQEHARRGLRMSGPAYQAIDQVEYERGFSDIIESRRDHFAPLDRVIL